MIIFLYLFIFIYLHIGRKGLILFAFDHFGFKSVLECENSEGFMEGLVFIVILGHFFGVVIVFREEFDRVIGFLFYMERTVWVKF